MLTPNSVDKYVVGPTTAQNPPTSLSDIDDMNAAEATAVVGVDTLSAIAGDVEDGSTVDAVAVADTLPLTTEAGTDFDTDSDENAEMARAPPSTPREERYWWHNDFLVIKRSRLGGLGAFAAKDLKYGDVVLVEKPLLRVNNWEFCNDYDELSDEDKTILHSLHKYSSNPDAIEIEKIRRANS